MRLQVGNEKESVVVREKAALRLETWRMNADREIIRLELSKRLIAS